jgi:hypothetical protein
MGGLFARILFLAIPDLLAAGWSPVFVFCWLALLAPLVPKGFLHAADFVT